MSCIDDKYKHRALGWEMKRGIDLRGLQIELRDPEVGKTMMSEAALVRLMKGMVTLATGEGSPRGT